MWKRQSVERRVAGEEPVGEPPQQPVEGDGGVGKVSGEGEIESERLGAGDALLSRRALLAPAEEEMIGKSAAGAEAPRIRRRRRARHDSRHSRPCRSTSVRPGSSSA